MKLVIIGNATVSELEELAYQKFSDVPLKYVIPPKCEYPYEGVQLPLEIRFDPVFNDHIMTLAFPLQIDIRQSVESQPLKYLSMLISYRGDQGLTQNLKRLGYVLDIDIGYSSLKCWTIMQIQFALTEKGLAEYEFIIKAFFEWINYLSKIYASPIIWDKMHKVSFNDFKFNSEKPSSADSSAFASNLQKYPLEYALTGDSVIFSKDDKVVRGVLDQININNAFNMLSSPEFHDQRNKLYTKFDKLDNIYGTKYTTTPYDKSKIAEFIPTRGEDKDITNTHNGDVINTKDFGIAQENKYLPTNLEMVCQKEWSIFRPKINFDDCSKDSFISDGNNIDVKLVSSNEKGETYFKQDRSFLIPIANINIRIETDKTLLQESTKLYFFETLLAEFTIQNFYSIEAGYSFTFVDTQNEK